MRRALPELWRWVERNSHPVLLAFGGLMALLILVGVWVSERRAESVTCTPEMKAFFDEFPQYDGGQWRPTPTERYCGIRVGTSGSEEEVFAYYSEKLRENGWQVAILEFPDSSEPTDAENRTLVGRKEGIYYYEVNYEPPGDRKRSSTDTESG